MTLFDQPPDQPPGPAAPAVHVVGYGRPATEALATAIVAAKHGHPLDPVTVVVASNVAGLSVRRLVGGATVGAGGLANVSFVTPFRLAELLGTGVVTGHPLTNVVLAATARGALRDDPGWFRPVAEHPASESALVALYAELSHLRPATIRALGARTARGGEMVRLFRAVRSRLTAFHDEDDLARAATLRLDSSPAAAVPLGRLIWFLPDRLTPAMGDLIAAGLRALPSTVVVGLTGGAKADAGVRHACRAAGVSLDPPFEGPIDAGPAAVASGPPTHAAAPTPTTGTRIISVSDPEEEVRAVVREVAALAERGMPLDRIGVFHPSPEPYARTLHEHFSAAGIPHNGPSRLRLADRVAGRTLLAALGLPDAGWARAALIAVAGDGPVRHEGDLAPVTAWDKLSREAGIVGGVADWQAKLAALAQARRAQHEADAGNPEATEWVLAGLRSDADRAEQLAAFVAGLAAAVDEVEVAVGWAGKVAATQALLVQLLGPEGRRTGWPEAERAAGERVGAAVARLELLDALDARPAAAAFVRAVASELDKPAGRIGRFGEGVLFGPLAMAPGLDLDAVFVMGMAEGVCPNPRREDALVPDDDREATHGELAGRDDALSDQHRSYLAALAAGAAHRVLTFPRGDLRGGRLRLPSRWLLDTATALKGERVHSGTFAGLGPAVVTEVPSFTAGLDTALASASIADRRLSALHAYRRAGGRPADHPCADLALRRGLATTAARHSDVFTVWDGNLAGEPVPSPAGGRRLSATAMQSWAECPFRYFLGQVLRLGDRPEPEAVTSIGAADRGTLVHAILERFIRDAIQRPDGPPGPGTPWAAADRQQLQVIAGEEFDRVEAEGKTGRPLTWRLERSFVRDDLDRFLDHDNALREARGTRPAQVELAFGLDGAEPLVLDVGDGRTLQFRGRIDRVDETANGDCVVFDYKTGKGDRYRELEKDPVRAGGTLQLGLYAEAARAQLGGRRVSSYYWMITSAGEFKVHGYEWTDDRRGRFYDVLAAITDGIEAGTFPALSGDYDGFFRSHDNCRFCPFDPLCPRDRDDHQRAKAGAPELAVLERLALPEPAT